MWNENYGVSVIPQDLRREETIQHYADGLDHMETISNDIFNRVSKRVAENRKHLESLQQRIKIAEAKINIVKGSNKAIQVFSSPKYPSNVELQNYVSVFADIDKSMQNVTRKYRKINSQINAFTEQDKAEKKQYYQVPVVKSKIESDTQEGLGTLPRNFKYISSFLFFNSSENPYKKYSIFDPLGGANKTKSNLPEAAEGGLADAPMSISNREEMERRDVENYLYIPDLGDVPEIDVPMDLPDLPGVADLMFSSDNIQGIAPSLLNVPNLPDVPGIAPSDDLPSLDPNIKLAPDVGPPPPPTNIPPPPPMSNPIPPPPTVIPPPPTVIAPPDPQNSEPTSTPAPPPSSSEGGGGGRSDLLASIRATGGAGKLKLKSSKERKMEKKKAKEDAPAASSGGGDLMSDLFSKLAMRRKGISGSKKAPEGQSPSSGGGSAMDKISAMIPPPPPVANNPSNDDDNDDWN